MSWKHIQGTWQPTQEEGGQSSVRPTSRPVGNQRKRTGVSLDHTERQQGSLFVLKHKEKFESH